MATDQTGDQRPGSPGRGIQSSWLALAGAVLVAAVMLPPLETLARRHLFGEAIQFCVLAMIGPALIALAAPRLRFAGGTTLSPGGASPPRTPLTDPPAHGAAARPPVPPWADALAVPRSGTPSFITVVVVLGAWIGACLVWRLPPVLDGLAQHPWLAAAELVTLLPTGILLWLELVSSPRFAPSLARPWRAVVAACAMWSIWIIAYLLGFASGSVVHAYDASGSLTTVTDQEITAAVLWLVSAACFVPLVFIPLMTWLRDDADPREERAVPRVGGGVRGWDRGAGGSRRQARR